MGQALPDDWSPADHPYAIAVSEGEWWQRTARLAILRIRDGDDRRLSFFSSRQIDARQMVLALRQLLAAERLEQEALRALGVDPAVGQALSEARHRYEDALPGIKNVRDALVHFDDWSRGEGKYGPQKQRRQAGEAMRDVARSYWGFAYDPSANTISMGPYSIDIDIADRATVELSQAIYAAAREVDRKSTAELRVKTITALSNAGIPCDSPEEAFLNVSPGTDLRIWLSLRVDSRSNEQKARDASERIVAALATRGLHLVSTVDAESLGAVNRLARGEALIVESDARDW